MIYPEVSYDEQSSTRDTFSLIGNLCEIKGDVIYVILAYRKAAESLMALPREASEYWKEGKLCEIHCVGTTRAE